MENGGMYMNKNTGAIKIIAVILMLIDHMGASIFSNVPELRILGRMALPLFAWTLVLGANYTKNIWKYIFRVLLLGITVQPLYMIALNHTWGELNIMFTLSLGLFGIAGIQIKKYASQYILPIIAIAVSYIIRVDYGWQGILFIILLYCAKDTKMSLIAFFTAFALFWGSTTYPVQNIFGFSLNSDWLLLKMLLPFLRIQSLSVLALPILLYPSKTQWKLPKWLNYALYPLHLLLLMVLQILFGSSAFTIF